MWKGPRLGESLVCVWCLLVSIETTVFKLLLTKDVFVDNSACAASYFLDNNQNVSLTFGGVSRELVFTNEQLRELVVSTQAEPLEFKMSSPDGGTHQRSFIAGAGSASITFVNADITATLLR